MGRMLAIFQRESDLTSTWLHRGTASRAHTLAEQGQLKTTMRNKQLHDLGLCEDDAKMPHASARSARCGVQGVEARQGLRSEAQTGMPLVIQRNCGESRRSASTALRS